MYTLGIDIETYSSIDVVKAGMYRHVEAEDFQILLFSYSLDDEPPVCIDLYHEKLPEWMIELLFDEDVLKTAHNAAFEMVCLSKHVGRQMIPEQWECTMTKASMAGYPLALDVVAKAMGLVEKKDPVGKALIKFFSKPCTGKRDTRPRNLPHHDWHKWNQFKQYNLTDVAIEQAIRRNLTHFRINEVERANWLLDQEINQRGILIDKQMVESAIHINEINFQRLTDEAKQLTGIDNPNSLKQLKEWLTEQNAGVYSMTKQYIKEILPHVQDTNVKQLLQLRQELSKSSIKKYKPMLLCLSQVDARARGLLQFYGANKTGRWSSRLIQIQNLVKNKLKEIDLARSLVRSADLEALELFFDNVADVLSQLCRTAFIAKPDHTLLVSDFSAIEARVVAWFADETWRLDVFSTHGKIYEASGAKMFKVSIDEVKGDLRFKAKTAELALGYQGGVGAIIRMEEQGLKTGLEPEERQPLIDLWRSENKKIVKLWYNCEAAALEAVRNPGRRVKTNKLEFFVKHNTLWIKLPSGRHLAYVKPHLKIGKFDKEVVGFWGVDQETKKWCHQDTYGGKIVENVVQGTSRDVLADAMLRLNAAGFQIVMHVHDEVVMEVPIKGKDQMLKKAGEIMSQKLPWAEGLPLAVKSYTTDYYLKDD